MKAVNFSKEKKTLEYSTDIHDIPQPRSGEVLIKVEAAVLNPSDLYMMQGDYGGTFAENLVPGNEGSGTVIATGGGIAAWMLKGKRVGFTRPSESGGKYTRAGSYGEYVVTNAMQCVALDNNASWEKGACSFVNPLTAVGLLDKCKEYRARAVIQTGAASSLGRMIIKVFRQAGIPLVNVVRREEQIALLKEKYGAEYVLNSTSETFDKDLYALSKKLDANVALECVAGEMPGRILQVLAVGGILISYGQLSE